MDIREQLEKVKWVDLGLDSETLWAASDIVLPEGMTSEEIEREFGDYLPSLGMLYELYRCFEWEMRPVSKKKNSRNSYKVTSDNGKSIIFDVFEDKMMYASRDHTCYYLRFPNKSIRGATISPIIDYEGEMVDGIRFYRFRPVKARKDVIFSWSRPYFVKRRSYMYDGKEVTELIFNAFPIDYTKLEQKAGYQPGPSEIPSYLFKNEYLSYFFKDRVIWVNLLDKGFFVRLVRCDRGWFNGSESYGQEIATLLSNYFRIHIYLEKRYYIDKRLAVCYKTGANFSYVYDPREFNGEFAWRDE